MEARRRIVVVVATLLLVFAAITACTSDAEPSAAFCERLKTATGPLGAESAVGAFDPTRVSAVTQELRELLSVAPSDIRPTMADYIELFEAIEATDDKELPAFLITQENQMRLLSGQLTSYAVNECGLFLQRAPLPSATPAPLVLPG